MRRMEGSGHKLFLDTGWGDMADIKSGWKLILQSMGSQRTSSTYSSSSICQTTQPADMAFSHVGFYPVCIPRRYKKKPSVGK